MGAGANSANDLPLRGGLDLRRTCAL